MDTDRCFIAVKINPFTEAYEFLTEIKKNFQGKISLTLPQNYHITTHFFGDITKPIQETIAEVMDDLKFSKFLLNLNVPGFFPKHQPTRLRVLYIAPSQGEKEFMNLYDKLTTLLRGVKFKKKKSFSPHLTVGRVKYGNTSDLAEKWKNFKVEKIFDVNKITLYKSILKPSGAEYTVLHERRFD